jgi:hypothetical protein
MPLCAGDEPHTFRSVSNFSYSYLNSALSGHFWYPTGVLPKRVSGKKRPGLWSKTAQARLTQAMQSLSAMDRSKVIHVISDRARWAVLRERAKRATRVLADREEAITLARSMAHEAGGEVIVHRKDGTIQEWEVVRDGRLETVYSYGAPSSPED